MRNAIIVGASSGIGRALASVLSSQGNNLGLAARRVDLLQLVAKEVQTTAFVKLIDVSRPEEAMFGLRELIAEMQGVELFVISAGTGFPNPTLIGNPRTRRSP